MITFTPRPAGPTPEEEPDLAWLQKTLARLAPERGLAPGCAWEVQPGVREASPRGGPRLAQTGYRITARDTAGRLYPLPCFVRAGDLAEPELREDVEEVLALWLDRLTEISSEGAGSGPPGR
jgi:hypothetical protein